jgi:hypothetical protein
MRRRIDQRVVEIEDELLGPRRMMEMGDVAWEWRSDWIEGGDDAGKGLQ